MSIQNIPAELRKLAQWVVSGPDKIPRTPRTGQLADPTDPHTWGTFEDALRAGMKHIGFVLSKDDPYAIIDLDDPRYLRKGVPDPDPASVARKKERHRQILEAAESYAETSQSGDGVHIIIKGSIPHGVRKDCVEVYSDARYMVTTGATLNALPIADRQELLDVLFQEMATTERAELVENDELLPDEEVWEMASRAVNNDKFMSLWAGTWEDDYPSQSEADFALMAMLCYYSKSNEQCRRLFRMSELGKRDKARRDKYLDYMIVKCRSHEPPPVSMDDVRARAALLVPKTPPSPPKQDERQRPNQTVTKPVPPPPTGTRGRTPLEYPPGFIGELATYFEASAIRPVREIALASALGLVAGITGRSYNVSGTGLNQYLILLAGTGSGKEGIASGIDAVIAAVRAQIPMADRFIGPATFASGQALVRVLDERPCFCSILGEFGITLQQLCDPRAPTPTSMLKKVLLDIYNKSGFNKMLRPSVYSDNEKNTKMIQAPNVTILGESTQEEFYGGLDASHVLGGLIPRFSIIEYTGPRPARNPDAFQSPPEALVDKLAELITIALTTQQNGTCCPVQLDTEATRIFDELDTYADKQINSSVEIDRHLWNRAHLKALKLGALLAVGCDAQQPTITRELAEWAREFVLNDVQLISAKFAKGDIGEGQSKQENDLRLAMMDYLKMPKLKRESYRVPEKLLGEPLVPYCYLRRRLRLVASFKNDRRGFNVALDTLLEAMVKDGGLSQIDRRTLSESYDTTSPAYALGPTF